LKRAGKVKKAAKGEGETIGKIPYLLLIGGQRANPFMLQNGETKKCLQHQFNTLNEIRSIEGKSRTGYLPALSEPQTGKRTNKWENPRRKKKLEILA